MKTSTRNRLLSALLAVMMIISLLPAAAFAAEPAAADHVVINQAYGGGGNSGAEYKNDFVELYNPTGKDVSLDGWSIQYAAKTGSFNSITPLSGSIKAGGYYLIQMAAGAGGTKDLPVPDCFGSAAMSAKEFKLALVKGTDAASGKADASVVDFLGVGGANEFEGSAAAPMLSNTTAALRTAGGVDTDDNASDFTAAAPNPRNSAAAAEPDPYPDIDPKYSVYAPVAEPQDGDTVLIYNPGYGAALSSEAQATYYLKTEPLTVTDGVLATEMDTINWTVAVQDGVCTFSQGDKMLSAYKSGTHINISTDASKDTGWKLAECNAETHAWYLYSATLEGSYGNVYIERHPSYDEFTVFDTSADRLTEEEFGFVFYKLVREGVPEEPSGLPEAGDQVVLYNANAQGVLAAQDDNAESPSITNAAAGLTDGVAAPANGARVFTVEKNGDYYRFKTAADGYLCSNGTGSNAFYSQTASEDADWLITECNGGVGGYDLESRTAKYKGYSQWLEYYADSYKTYSMDPSQVTDYTIYSFYFCPVADGTPVTDGVVNKPAVDFGDPADAFLGQDYTLAFTVNAPFGVKSLTVKLGEQELTAAAADGAYTVAIPAAQVTGEQLVFTVSGTDNKDVAFAGTVTVAVKDEPVISDMTPASGSETGDNKQPEISAAIANAGENATVAMTVNGEAVKAVYADGKVSYTPAAAMADGRVSVTVTATRADGKSAEKTWSFYVGKTQFQLYFGQLHSHTGEYSDGAGTLQSALDYIAGLPESANVDFVAFTDHSNYFDTTSDANPEDALYDMSKATAYSQKTWAAYKGAIADFNARQADVVALGGFEMTWSGGPGHINTFNTEGIVSRNNKTLNNKTSDAGMKAYYALLSQAEGADSLSQFNHPGTTFGNFTDFSYWDAVIDSRICMVEVGNGEGQVGAGGYYPSYEQYTMALDKGWHVAPTNNQDNHKGKWGNANDARDVILTDDFSEQGLYDAIRAMRMYATEDKNLELYYTVNGQQLGSIIQEVPEKLNLSVQVSDPDASDSISKVEVIVNSGKVAYTWDSAADLARGELSRTLDPTYSYYYIRVTEQDGDIAVTAPVWVGETLKLGISNVECGTSTPVTGEALTLTTTLFNSENTEATVKSVTYTIGSEVIGTDSKGYTLPASGGTQQVSFQYTPEKAKVTTVTVTAVMELDGEEYTYTMDISLDVLAAEQLVYIGIDAAHYNEYVAGNYKDSMGNFGELAAGYSVRTVELKTSDDLIAACSNPKYKAIILTAPSRRDGSALREPYATYTDKEMEALVAFNANGGALVLAGWSDQYEAYAQFPAADHMAAQQNKLLAALGSSLRIGDDTAYDEVNGAASDAKYGKWRLYPSNYNLESPLMAGVEFDPEHPNDNMYTQLFSQYGGATLYTVDGSGNPTTTLPGTVTPAVYGYETTESKDMDSDALGTTQRYAMGNGKNAVLLLASEQLEGKGLIVVSGAAFMSNFEVQAKIEDSGAEKNYSNYRICENLVQSLNPVTVTDIADVQKQTEAGYKYTIEGVVTSNASGYDKDTAFFDCIYVQDATGGVCCFPVAGDFQIGDKVRVTGTTDFYQGEMELQVTSITKLGTGEKVAPKPVTAKQLNDGSVRGSLVTLEGTVQSFQLENGLVQTILVQDAQGGVARVFIDGYITKDADVQNLAVGAEITVTGLASYDNTFHAPDGPFPRIRVRDRADVVCGDVVTHKCDAFKDINMWAKDSICYMVEHDYMNGVSTSKFQPNVTTTRAMMVTVLYRIAGEPDVSGLRNPFRDVANGQWYTDAVVWAAANGIAKGMSAATFDPTGTMTRAQMATFLMRYAEYQKQDTSARADLSGYTDAASVPGWAANAMQWAVAGGIVNGMTAKTLVPGGSSTRAQLATVVARYLTK